MLGQCHLLKRRVVMYVSIVEERRNVLRRETRQPFEGIDGREIEPELVFTSEFS